jgi:hypothetical protein
MPLVSIRTALIRSALENLHSTSNFDHSRDITLHLQTQAANIPHALNPQALNTVLSSTLAPAFPGNFSSNMRPGSSRAELRSKRPFSHNLGRRRTGIHFCPSVQFRWPSRWSKNNTVSIFSIYIARPACPVLRGESRRVLPILNLPLQPCNSRRAPKAQNHARVTPFLATLTHSLSRNPFVCHFYANTRDMRTFFGLRSATSSPRTSNSFRFNSSEQYARNPFRMRSYRNPGGRGVPIATFFRSRRPGSPLRATLSSLRRAVR